MSNFTTMVSLSVKHTVEPCDTVSEGHKINVLLTFLGKHMKLSPEAEEVATFFAKMLDHEYTTKDVFRKNFFKDWRKVERKCTCRYTYTNFRT